MLRKLFVIFLLFSNIFIYGQDSVNEYINKIKNTHLLENKSELYYKIGNIYQKNNYDSAFYYYDLAIKNTKDVQKIKNIAYNINILGIYYATKLNSFDKAMNCFFKSLKVYEQLDDKEGMANCYSNFGAILYEQKEYDKAIGYFFKSLQLNKIIDNKQGTLSSLLNIGQCYSLQKKHDYAHKFFLMSLKIAKEIKHVDIIALLYNNMGFNIFNQAKTINDIANSKYSKAKEYFTKSLNIYKENNFMRAQADVLNGLAQVYYHQDSLKAAIKFADSSLLIAKKIQALQIQLENYENLSNIYEKFNNTSKALYYHKLYKQINDSIFNAEKSNQINNLHIRYETEKKENEILNQNIKIDLLEKQKEVEKYKSVWLTTFIIMFIIISITVILYLQKRNKSNKLLYEQQMKNIETKKILSDTELKNQKLISLQLQNELKYKNQEIVNLALHISERNDFLRIVRKQLINRRKNADINKIIGFINQNLIALEKEKKEFEAHIESVSHSFYVKLQEKIPDISKSEERLAALLKLNLSSKEIASILNIAIKSVDMSRYRLRKKLNLSKDENLVEYLNNL